MTGETLALAQQFTDRDVIEAVVNSYFIIDYGVITKVNADDTVNVTHAKIQELMDGTQLPALETKNIELLTLSCGAFSININAKSGDKVLLLGLKDYVPAVDDVSGATKQDAYMHYKRDTMKALPLCVFNDDAKVKIEISDSGMTVTGDVKVTGGKCEIGGSVTPTGSGAFCGLPYCAFTGAPQCGSISNGT